MLQEHPKDRPTIDEIMRDFEKCMFYDSELKNFLSNLAEPNQGLWTRQKIK